MQSGSTPEIKDYFKDLQTPDIADMEIQLQRLVEQGVLSPEEAATVNLDKVGSPGTELEFAL